MQFYVDIVRLYVWIPRGIQEAGVRVLATLLRIRCPELQPLFACRAHFPAATHAWPRVWHQAEPHSTSSTIDYLDIFSSSRPFVRGPIRPIASITISIAPAINTNTPVVPKPFSTEAIRNAVKIAEKRLHE
jgi:hypothetical protein